MGLQEKISELQQKPYRQRLKILWVGVAIAAIITIIIWIITIKIRSNANTDNGLSPLKEIFQNYGKSQR